MIVDDAPFSDPPSYPKSGTYSDLLFWHLEIWGTGNGGNMACAGERWHPKAFLEKVIGTNFDFDSDRPNLENWLGQNGPPRRPRDTSIENVLFGAPPAFQRWRIDLRNAHSRSRGKDKDGQYRNRRMVEFDLAVRDPITTADVPAIISIAGRNFAHRQLHKLKVDPTNLNELLRTDVRATTLVERGDELVMLAAWRDAPQGIAVKCVIGAAGAGKTRLAIEACEAAEAAGWFATFVPSGELLASSMAQKSENHPQPRHTLIVIDYAATSAKTLKSWFDELALWRSNSDHKLRVLLLERHADSQHGWWADLLRPDSNDHASAGDLIGTEVPYALKAIDTTGGRRTLLAEVMLKAAPLFDPPKLAVVLPPLGAAPWFDQRLAEDKLDNEPLYLMMAGIRAVESGVPAALAMNRLDLAQRMATFELERLKKFSKARGFFDKGKLLTHIAACVTLQNGCHISELLALIKAERCALEMTAPFDDEAVAEILCDFLPVVDRVEAVRPDLIGESFCLPIVEGGKFRKQAQEKEIILRCWRRDPVGTIDTLVRCACDLAAGDANHTAVRHLRAVVEVSDDLLQLYAIADSLPKQTLALREVAVDVQAAIVQFLILRVNANPNIFTPELAGALVSYSIRLGTVGRREDSLDAIKKGLALYRPLAARNDAFMPDLARSFHTLANRLSAMGLREDALAAIEEAVSLYHPLAAARHDIFAPDLARSLHNLANRLRAMGRREDALSAIEKAVELYRPLAEVRPDAFLPDLARSLHNLANRLRAVGRREDALRAIEEAVARYRPLAVARPDAFLPDLARSLHNLANRLSAMGRKEDALDAIEKAVAVYRPLAGTRPEVFTPNLARSLNNLANRLGDLGRFEDALGAIEEAVSLYSPLAKARPDTFASDFARSLQTLANRLGDMRTLSTRLKKLRHSIYHYS